MKEKFYVAGSSKLIQVDAERVYYVNYQGKIRKCKVLEMIWDWHVHVKSDREDTPLTFKKTVLNIAGLGVLTFTNEGACWCSGSRFCPTIYRTEADARKYGTNKSYEGLWLVSGYELRQSCIDDCGLEIGKDHHGYKNVKYAYTWDQCEVRRKSVGQAACPHFGYDYLKGKFFFELADGWFVTEQECREAHGVDDVVEFEDEEPDEDDFAEQKREEFRDYVAHHCPGFEDRIDWEYFMNLKSMPENLAMQVENWTRA